jgi:hypothetical protein
MSSVWQFLLQFVILTPLYHSLVGEINNELGNDDNTMISTEGFSSVCLTVYKMNNYNICTLSLCHQTY